MKDLLQEFRTWDTIEDYEKGFCGYVRQLPRNMEVRDQEKVIKAMKTLDVILKFMIQAIRREYNEADASYSEIIIELVNKHPYFVDLPCFEEVFSDQQKSIFELYDETIAENKCRMMFYKVDERCVRELQAKLQEAEEKCAPLRRQVIQLGILMRCVKASISSLELELHRRNKPSLQDVMRDALAI